MVSGRSGISIKSRIQRRRLQFTWSNGLDSIIQASNLQQSWNLMHTCSVLLITTRSRDHACVFYAHSCAAQLMTIVRAIRPTPPCLAALRRLSVGNIALPHHSTASSSQDGWAAFSFLRKANSMSPLPSNCIDGSFARLGRGKV